MFSKVQYFKVKWMQALDLLASRKVLVRGGFAYVPRDRLVNIIVNIFRAYVSGPVPDAPPPLPRPRPSTRPRFCTLMFNASLPRCPARSSLSRFCTAHLPTRPRSHPHLPLPAHGSCPTRLHARTALCPPSFEMSA
jgi:hypothetical protein